MGAEDDSNLILTHDKTLKLEVPEAGMATTTYHESTDQSPSFRQ